MREIKFRAWDEDDQEMLKPQDLSQCAAYWTWLGNRDVPLMQYTGLKDKNGIEIYEGDICFYVSRRDSANMVVEFEEGKFILKGTQGHTGYKDLLWLQKEIIGNIHKNPELLEE